MASDFGQFSNPTIELAIFYTLTNAAEGTSSPLNYFLLRLAVRICGGLQNLQTDNNEGFDV